jgi:hypothetical protein
MRTLRRRKKKKQKNMEEDLAKQKILEAFENVYWVDYVEKFDLSSDYPSLFEQRFGHISRVSITFDDLKVPYYNINAMHELLKKWNFGDSIQYGIENYETGYYFNKILKISLAPSFLPKNEDFGKEKGITNELDFCDTREKFSMVFCPLLKDKEIILEFVRELLESNILVMPINDKKFFMIAQGPNGLFKQQTSFKNIPIKDDRYDLYYGKSFPHEEILKFFDEDSDNLMILYGIPGSGKSNYIKNLIHYSKEDVIYIPPSMVGVISDPSFVSFMLENRGNVLIIEDAEQILSVDRNAATNNLLGLTDGFLKDSLKLKVITTLNADIKTIDKALTRKGRLHLSHYFGKLTKDESNELADFCDIDHTFDEDTALCDIFNFEKFTSPLKKEEQSIGFGNF